MTLSIPLDRLLGRPRWDVVTPPVTMVCFSHIKSMLVVPPVTWPMTTSRTTPIIAPNRFIVAEQSHPVPTTFRLQIHMVTTLSAVPPSLARSSSIPLKFMPTRPFMSTTSRKMTTGISLGTLTRRTCRNTDVLLTPVVLHRSALIVVR